MNFMPSIIGFERGRNVVLDTIKECEFDNDISEKLTRYCETKSGYFGEEDPENQSASNRRELAKGLSVAASQK